MQKIFELADAVSEWDTFLLNFLLADTHLFDYLWRELTGLWLLNIESAVFNTPHIFDVENHPVHLNNICIQTLARIDRQSGFERLAPREILKRIVKEQASIALNADRGLNG